MRVGVGVGSKGEMITRRRTIVSSHTPATINASSDMTR